VRFVHILLCSRTQQLLVFVDGSAHEVHERHQVVFRHVLGEEAQGVSIEAPLLAEAEVEAESNGDQKGGQTDDHHDKLLAKEGRDEAASEERSEEAVIRLLGSGLAVLPHGVVVVVVALVTHRGGLGGAVTVASDGLSLRGAVRVLGDGLGLRGAVLVIVGHGLSGGGAIRVGGGGGLRGGVHWRGLALLGRGLVLGRHSGLVSGHQGGAEKEAAGQESHHGAVCEVAGVVDC